VPRNGSQRVRDALRDGQARLAKHVGGLEHADAVAVHQARVACRRLRALLKTFKPFFAEEPATAYRQVLGRIANALNDTRELDVLAAHREFRELRLAAQVAVARERAAAQLRRNVRRLHGQRRLALARRGPSATTLGLPGVLEAPAVLRRVRRAWRHARGLFEHSHRDDQIRHLLRIQLKNIRYTLELIEDLNPVEAPIFMRRLRRAQQVLGDERDLAAALEWLDAARLRSQPARAARRHLVRRHRQMEARLPAALASVAQAGDRWDRAVTHALKAERSPGREGGRRGTTTAS
jgi:CHAD domain-containing protein